MNRVASEYRIPPAPPRKFDIPILNMNDVHLCSTCCKADVCKYKDEITETVNKIQSMTRVSSIPIDTTNIKCKAWVGKTFGDGVR